MNASVTQQEGYKTCLLWVDGSFGQGNSNEDVRDKL